MLCDVYDLTVILNSCAKSIFSIRSFQEDLSEKGVLEFDFYVILYLI